MIEKKERKYFEQNVQEKKFPFNMTSDDYQPFISNVHKN